jgi:MSHA biogenesis protein MshL
MSSGIRRFTALAVAIPIALALASCASSPEEQHGGGETALVDEMASTVEPPKEVLDALIPTLDLGFASSPGIPEPRFDVTVDRAPAREFFMSLVEGTSYSLALAPEVQGELSLSLRDVTVEEVLDTVRQAYGFGFERTRTGFLVLPAGLRTRVFRVDYLNLQRSGSSDTRVSSGQISDQISGGENIIAGQIDADSGSSGSGGSVSGSRIQTHSETDLWQELIGSVEAIVGTEGGRSVVGSPNASLIVVRALPSELEKVSTYLRSAETSLNRVVILEAKILEVTLSDGFQSGINWALMQSINGTDFVIGQAGGGTVNDTGFSSSRGQSQNVGPPLEDLLLGTMSSAFGGVFSLAISSNKFAAFIELLEAQGEVRTLSNPRISTVNNQKAVIKVGQDEFFVTDISTTTVTGTATTSSPNVTLTPFFSGIALDVTPQISESNEVILHVHPAVTEVVDQVKAFVIQDELQELPTALSSIRESDSIVRARSGEIVVIGGLIQNNSKNMKSGLPWISRLPWIGNFFAHRTKASRRTELVILLRPIVVDDDTWGHELRTTSSHLDENFDPGRSARGDELRLDGWLPPTPPVSR